MTQDLAGVPPGGYSLTVTDSDSCSAVFFWALSFQDADRERQAAGFTAQVVPNPSGRGAGAQVWIASERHISLRLRLTDAQGRLRWERQAEGPAGGTALALPTGLAAGMYWVWAASNEGQVVLKWVVE